MANRLTSPYTYRMTFQVIVEAKKGQPVVVKVDAASEEAAKEIARWLVAHAAHLQAHGSARPIKA